jgi:hypothetical protein
MEHCTKRNCWAETEWNPDVLQAQRVCFGELPSNPSQTQREADFGLRRGCSEASFLAGGRSGDVYSRMIE